MTLGLEAYTYRAILGYIAQLQGCFAKVNRTNKVQFYLLNDPNGTYEQITANSMNSKLEINKKYGPVNVVSFTMKNIEGENVTLKENTSITTNGETTIEIQDNPFMVNQNARELAISALFGSLVGFEYIPTVFNYKARLYNDCGDKIQVYDVDSESYVNSLILNQTIEIPATRKSKMENKALSKTQVKNQYISKTEQEGSHTELLVDKQNQTIQAVISNVTEQNTKISQINQRVDEISSQISDIADITTSAETSYASVNVTGINESEPIMVKIHPSLVNISYLYPRANLYPSDDLYMTDRRICFHNTTNNTKVYYTLPDDLLWYNQNVYDEFYFDWESQTCQVVKRCGYNADGTVYALQNEVTTNYPFPTIHLLDGDYTISILGYQYGYLFVRLVASNIYTDQFATKIEVNSKIDQKADEIDLEVNEKLTNYSTTSQMNSAIAIKAGEITSTVASIYETKTNAQTKYSQLQQTDTQISSTVATKVGKNEIISKINQSSEAVTINANKISLDGKTINLTSGNITISSTNFSVTSNGTATMVNADITGELKNYSSNTGKIGVKISDTAIRLYDWKNSGVWVGNVSSIYNSTAHQSGIALSCKKNDEVVIGYKDSENDTTVNTLMQFDTRDLTKTPWIKNTSTGNIFAGLNGGGIVVENGLIKSWDLTGIKNGTVGMGNGSITVTNGLITNWQSTAGATGTARFKSYIDGWIANVEIQNGLIVSVTHERE